MSTHKIFGIEVYSSVIFNDPHPNRLKSISHRQMSANKLKGYTDCLFLGGIIGLEEFDYIRDKINDFLDYAGE
jgi:hypothetical protein